MSLPWVCQGSRSNMSHAWWDVVSLWKPGLYIYFRFRVLKAAEQYPKHYSTPRISTK